MKNDLLTIGSFTIHGYGLMIGIGIIAAYCMTEYRAKKHGLDEEQIFPLAIWGVAAGLLGAKLLYYVTIFGEIVEDPSLLLDFSDGFVVYGGIIGGIAGGLLFARIKKLDFWKYFDLVMPSVALAQGFGRIGCLLAGCCYGAESSGALSIVFHNSAFAPNGIPLIPTQPISSLLNFLHFGILLIFSRYAKADGQVSALYLILYSTGRFVLEFFRGDLIRGSVGALSTSQFISVFMFLIGCALFIFCTIRGKKAAAE